jgi:glycosyltransferase involved in cell wall biosynthesis
MIVLMVHNSYKERGGEDVVYEMESRLLEECGHTVHRYHEDNSCITLTTRIRAGLSAIWSQRSYRRVAQLIRQTRCDVVHCHNTFPLVSPSVYYAAKSAGVPVVQTLHNYRILCPNALLFRDGNVCEACLDSPLKWRGVAHACYRQSRLSSASVAAMLAVHRALGTWDKMIDLYIAPSRFSRDKYVQAGFAPERIAVKPGFVYPDPGPGDHRGDYCLFVGRLSAEKGLDVLFDAWRKLGPSIPLKVVGDGPFSPLAAAAVKEMPWIEWLGYKPPSEVLQLMGEARALVLPSLWYETFGLVVIEAFAKGTPAIVPDGGALKELVRHGCNGFHFDARSADALAGTVQAALNGNDRLAEMGRSARADFLETYTAAANAKALVEFYRRVTGRVTDSVEASAVEPAQAPKVR